MVTLDEVFHGLKPSATILQKPEPIVSLRILFPAPSSRGIGSCRSLIVPVLNQDRKITLWFIVGSETAFFDEPGPE